MVSEVSKKSNFISNVITQATNLLAVRDALKLLAEENQNEFGGGQSLALVDADFVGTNAFMTAAQMATFFSSVQPALESAIANNLQALEAVIPQ